MLKLAAAIDRLNDVVGRFVSWGVLALVVLQFAVVILRYVFGVGFVWVQETITYVYASVFMCAAGYTLLRDGHVRVDIWFREASARARAVVDLLGALVFLWPVTGLLIWVAWPYVSRSFLILEGSREPGGLPLLYLLKAEILIFAAVLALQGLARAIRAVAILVRGEHHAEGAAR
ncbi:MAG: TRAP transporter small permease subunit [Hyphomicrobiales bacterium]|nr:TRAP transporter small permease subunit [Hyphomicrobiales bacterium]